eukprot:gnl/MRDRNA2_/MRDRNA2_106031_c0_seq1.p1 gnl/MRDRNA2_/MRDRNA2_106031_c0~~gnl/MRDRNA2_/MRDRNA2_106031_c0_seq1.p1  ORF type:complete len:1245 (+),score=325.33 gnl/MRDRNA2_/MRDRNA2_106031_c0_seq1:196-3735(+)
MDGENVIDRHGSSFAFLKSESSADAKASVNGKADLLAEATVCSGNGFTFVSSAAPALAEPPTPAFHLPTAYVTPMSTPTHCPPDGVAMQPKKIKKTRKANIPGAAGWAESQVSPAILSPSSPTPATALEPSGCCDVYSQELPRPEDREAVRMVDFDFQSTTTRVTTRLNDGAAPQLDLQSLPRPLHEEPSRTLNCNLPPAGRPKAGESILNFDMQSSPSEGEPKHVEPLCTANFDFQYVPTATRQEKEVQNGRPRFDFQPTAPCAVEPAQPRKMKKTRKATLPGAAGWTEPQPFPATVSLPSARPSTQVGPVGSKFEGCCNDFDSREAPRPEEDEAVRMADFGFQFAGRPEEEEAVRMADFDFQSPPIALGHEEDESVIAQGQEGMTSLSESMQSSFHQEPNAMSAESLCRPRPTCDPDRIHHGSMDSESEMDFELEAMLRQKPLPPTPSEISPDYAPPGAEAKAAFRSSSLEEANTQSSADTEANVQVTQEAQARVEDEVVCTAYTPEAQAHNDNSPTQTSSSVVVCSTHTKKDIALTPASAECAEKLDLSKARTADTVHKWLNEELSTNAERHQEVAAQQAQLSAKVTHARAELLSVRQRLASAEANQNRLCAEDRFEEAGALDHTIRDFKDAMTSKLEAVAAASRENHKLGEKLLALSNERSAALQDAHARMQALHAEKADTLQEVRVQNEKRLSLEASRVASEQERLSLSRSHLKKDSSALEDECQQINDKIKEQTEEHKLELDSAVSRRHEVEEEIKDLQMKLEQALNLRAELNETIHSREIKITSIQSKFEKHVSRLEGKRRRLDEAQREFEVDELTVDTLKAEHSINQQRSVEMIDEHSQELAGLRNASTMLSTRRRFASQYFKARQAWQDLLEPLQRSLGEAYQQMEKSACKSREAMTAVASKEAQCHELRSQIASTQAQLLVLEGDKKLAVASRSFKEAGRLTQEINKHSEEGKKAEADLETLQKEVAVAREALIKQQTHEEKAQSELLALEEENDVIRLQILGRQLRDVGRLRGKARSGSADQKLLESEAVILQREYDILLEKVGPRETDVELLEQMPFDDDCEEDEEEEDEEKDGVKNAKEAMSGEAVPAHSSATAGACSAAGFRSLSHAQASCLLSEKELLLGDNEEKIASAVSEENFSLADELAEQSKALQSEVEVLQQYLSDLER